MALLHVNKFAICHQFVKAACGVMTESVMLRSVLIFAIRSVLISVGARTSRTYERHHDSHQTTSHNIKFQRFYSIDYKDEIVALYYDYLNARPLMTIRLNLILYLGPNHQDPPSRQEYRALQASELPFPLQMVQDYDRYHYLGYWVLLVEG